MQTGYILFSAMVVPMAMLVWTHFVCRKLTYWHPHIMPDNIQRNKYRKTEAGMAYACVAMIWAEFMILPEMVAICAIDPWLGYISHGPWVAATWYVLYRKVGHMRRLIEQVG